MAVFVGFQVPPAISAGCVALQRELAEAVEASAVHPDDLHMTLAYLGNRSDEEIGLAGRAVAESVAAVPPVGIVLDGPVGYEELNGCSIVVFQDNGIGQTLWEDLNERLLSAVGYQQQFKSWLPHITILRHEQPLGLEPRLEPLPEFTPVGPRLFLSAQSGSERRYRFAENG